jgi:hypothetical protein
LSPPLVVSESEMETALRLFADGVAAVEGGGRRALLRDAEQAGALTGVEAGG